MVLIRSKRCFPSDDGWEDTFVPEMFSVRFYRIWTAERENPGKARQKEVVTVGGWLKQLGGGGGGGGLNESFIRSTEERRNGGGGGGGGLQRQSRSFLSGLLEAGGRWRGAQGIPDRLQPRGERWVGVPPPRLRVGLQSCLMKPPASSELLCR